MGCGMKSSISVSFGNGSYHPAKIADHIKKDLRESKRESATVPLTREATGKGELLPPETKKKKSR